MKNKTIIFIKDKIINDCTVSDILKDFKNKNLGLDMSCVDSINSKLFIENLLSNKFKLFNLKSETLAFLSLILQDSSLKSYINKTDFIDEKRELVRRKFFIASKPTSCSKTDLEARNVVCALATRSRAFL